MTAKQVRKQLDDLQYKIKHRSGFNCKINAIDGSISDLINTVVESELMDLFISSIKDGNFDDDTIKQYCDEYLNKWMILHHNIIVKKQHFNWNWP